MTISASVLETLHRIHRQKSDLTGQLDRGPKQIQAAKNRIEACKKALEDIREKQKQLRMDADRRQLQLREREQRIVSLEGKMNAAKENREYQLLKEQIAADRQANNVLSDEILELLEQVDEVTGKIEPAQEQIRIAEAEAAETTKKVSERMKVVEGELGRVLNELAGVESGLEGDFKRDYERLISMRGEDGIAGTEGNCCGGCYQMLTPQLLDRLANHFAVVCPLAVDSCINRRTESMGLSSVEFWQRIAASQLASPLLCRTWAADAATALSASDALDAKRVGQQLVSQGKLTQFQLDTLLGESKLPLVRNGYRLLEPVDYTLTDATDVRSVWQDWWTVAKTPTAPKLWVRWLQVDEFKQPHLAQSNLRCRAHCSNRKCATKDCKLSCHLKWPVGLCSCALNQCKANCSVANATVSRSLGKT